MPGWLLSRTRADDMHTTKLGVGQYVIGNTLALLMERRVDQYLDPAVEMVLPPDASNQEVLDDLFLRYQEWLKDHKLGSSVKRFTLNRIHRESGVQQPVYLCKASQTVPLVSWLASLAIEWSERCPPEHKSEALVLANMLWGLASYFHICKSASRFFTDGEARQLDIAGHTFLYMYSELRRVAIREQTFLWPLAPKFHMFHHIVLDAMSDRVNPRYFHCFGDEDQVGRMIILARASHPLKTVSNTMILYWLGLARRIKSFDPAAAPVV